MVRFQVLFSQILPTEGLSYTRRVSQKSLIYLGLLVGSTIGGFIPALWHASLFSGWGIIMGALGGAVGIWAGYRLSQ